MSITCVIFRLGDRRFAMRVEAVERVLRAIEITPFSDNQTRLSGLINIEGEIIEVVNLRDRLGFGDRELELEDHIIISTGDDNKLAFVVDAVEDVLHCEEEQVAQFAAAQGGSARLLKLADGMVMLFDHSQVAAARQQNSVHGH